MPSSTRLLPARKEILSLLAPLLVSANAWTQGLSPIPASTTSERIPESVCPLADGPDLDRTYPIRKAAFEALNGKDPVAARHLMRCAIESDPSDKIALRQEVYLDLEAGDSDGAITDIDTLRRLGAADPQLEAQEGFVFAEHKNFAAAKAAFRRALETGDPEVRLSALKALGNLAAEPTSRTLTVDLTSIYAQRFGDGIVDGSIQLAQRLGTHSPVQLYLSARLLRDTASGINGTLPRIFDDNAFLPGIGLALQPARSHLSLTAEANEAYVLYSGTFPHAAWVPDFRVVAGYFNRFQPPPASRISDRLRLQLNGSLGFYSRYGHDAISYLQPRESVPLLRSRSFHLEPFLEQSLALDTNRQFFNNVFELIPGTELRSDRLRDLALQVEYAFGFYLPVPASSANPYGPRYRDLRFSLTWHKAWSLDKAGD